jgi:hypothetical protein
MDYFLEDLIIHDIDVLRDRSSDEISDEELRKIGV